MVFGYSLTSMTWFDKLCRELTCNWKNIARTVWCTRRVVIGNIVMSSRRYCLIRTNWTRSTFDRYGNVEARQRTDTTAERTPHINTRPAHATNKRFRTSFVFILSIEGSFTHIVNAIHEITFVCMRKQLCLCQKVIGTQSHGSRWQPALNTCGTCKTSQTSAPARLARTQTQVGERAKESREKCFYRLHIWNERTAVDKVVVKVMCCQQFRIKWKLTLQMHRWLIDRFRCIAISWNATGSPQKIWVICLVEQLNGVRGRGENNSRLGYVALDGYAARIRRS